MEKEFKSLSDKIRTRKLQFTNDGLPLNLKWLPAKDVKEHIKLLKEKQWSLSVVGKPVIKVEDLDKIMGPDLT